MATSINTYFASSDRVRKEINTLRHDIQLLYNQGIEMLRGEGDLIATETFGDKLEDILSHIESGLWDKAKPYLKVDASIQNDPIRKALLLDSYCGLNKENLREAIINANREGANPVDASAFLKQAEKFAARSYKIRTQGAVNELKPENAAEVITYVDPTNSYKLDPNHPVLKMPTTLADILDHYKEAGILTPRYAESRPEIFKEAVRKT